MADQDRKSEDQESTTLKPQPTISVTPDDGVEEFGSPTDQLEEPDLQPQRKSTTESTIQTITPSNPGLPIQLTFKIKSQMARLRLAQSFTQQIKDQQQTITKEERLSLEKQLTALHESFNSEHQVLEEVWPPSQFHHPYIVDDVFETFNKSVSDFFMISAKVASKEPPAQSTSTSGASDVAQALARLPKLSVPKFHGTSASWLSFRDQFESMIANQPGLDEVIKFNYLKSALSGPALSLVENLPHTKESFTKAWSTLKSRYENRKRLINVHLEKLFSQFAESKRAALHSAKISSLLTIVDNSLDSLKLLGQSTENWDTILIFHILKHLDQHSRELWETQDNDLERMPTYSEFREFLLARIRTLEKLEPRIKSDNQQRSSHSTTSERRFICDCCNGGHFIVVCPEYRALPLEQRLRTVDSKKLCRNCLGRHNTPACTNKNRCKECNSKHHTMFHSLLFRQSSSTNNQASSRTQSSQQSSSDTQPSTSQQ
ncbi:uncharacterized protein [Chelonus insularis]|uniref:uncharacterized protein n=1 Tax=Chelonus insularis TaxID=460826 RepID=UPI0015890DF6|nr:uncharacterized protein LOC118070152 [Chelonus insularis]